MDVDYEESSDVYYTGIFLNRRSRKILTEYIEKNILPLNEDSYLLDNTIEDKWKIHVDHVTISYGYVQDDIVDSLGGIGATVELIATHIGNLDGLIYAVKVESKTNPNLSLVSENRTAHITLCSKPPMIPRYSNDIVDWIALEQSFDLLGKVKVLYKPTT